MNTILVVCVGNICRSPMAQGLLADALPGKTVISAGLEALIGNPPDPLAIKIMAERAIDISSHRAQQLNLPLCNRSDLIFVMDRMQKRLLEERYAVARGRVFRLGELKDQEIFDPYRLDEFEFRRCLDLISSNIQGWVRRLHAIG